MPNYSKADNRILPLLKIILGACLVAPLFAADSLLFPFTAPKGFLFRILVEIAAVLWLYSAWKKPSFFPLKSASLSLTSFYKGGLGRALRSFGEAGGFLNLSVLIFFAIWILSGIFGIDFNSSFWGNMERMIGVFGMAHFVLFFFLIQSVFNSVESFKNLFKVSAAASVLVSLLAVAQKFVSLGALMPQAERVSSTVGNPAFLASYLLFNVFFAAYFFQKSLEEKDKKSSWLFGAAILLGLAAIILTGTRGALLGLAAGAIMFFALAIFILPSKGESGKKIKKISLICLAAIFVLAGSVFAFRKSSFVQDNAILSRLTDISLNDSTIRNRVIVWQKSWQAWQEKPILGWGPENFEAAINKYFDPRLNPYEAWYDRAHNFIFDYGVSIGWLGILSYLSVLAAAFYYLIKIRRKDFFLFAVFAALFVSYIVQNLFIFDSFVSYLMLFFALAFIDFVYKNSFIRERPFQKEAKGIGVFPLVLGIVIIFFCFYSVNAKAVKASYWANQAINSFPSDYLRGNNLLKKSLTLETFASAEIGYHAATDYLSKVSRFPELARNKEFYDLCQNQLSRSVEVFPRQARYRVAQGWLNLYLNFSPAQANEVVYMAREVRKLAPAKKDGYLLEIAAQFVMNRKDKSEAVVLEAEKLDKILGEEVKNYWKSLNE